MSDNKIKRSDKKFNNNGFTLIEILIALAIFSIGILGVASMQIYSINYNSNSRILTEATTLGVDTMETLMILPLTDPWLAPNANPVITDGPYTATWTITPDPTIPNYLTIEMTVTWTGRGSAKRVLLNCTKSI